MKLTRHELVHSQDRQLAVIGIRRSGNAGWLAKAVTADFTAEQVRLFHDIRVVKRNAPPRPTAPKSQRIVQLETALQTISDHLPRFRDAFPRPDGPHKGYDVWLHDYIAETLNPNLAASTSLEAACAGFMHENGDAMMKALDTLSGSSPESFANQLFEQSGRDLA
jgi:hypothetical protein